MQESNEATPVDAHDARDPIKVELRASLKRERALHRKIENLLDGSRRERAAHIQLADEAMKKLVAENHQAIRALEAVISDQAHAYRQLEHDSLLKQHALQSEIWRTKLKCRYEVDAVRREMAAKPEMLVSGDTPTNLAPGDEHKHTEHQR